MLWVISDVDSILQSQNTMPGDWSNLKIKDESNVIDFLWDKCHMDTRQKKISLDNYSFDWKILLKS